MKLGIEGRGNITLKENKEGKSSGGAGDKEGKPDRDRDERGRGN